MQTLPPPGTLPLALRRCAPCALWTLGRGQAWVGRITVIRQMFFRRVGAFSCISTEYYARPHECSAAWSTSYCGPEVLESHGDPPLFPGGAWQSCAARRAG